MAKASRQDYQKTLMEFLISRPVAYWPALARRVGGVKAAVLLSQLLYWNGDDGIRSRGGWILLSVSDLEEQTGLTKLEQQTARLTLQELGVIDSCLKGIPRIWHYKINMDILSELLSVTIIGSVSHPMGKPLNGEPSQCSDGFPPNIETVSDPTLDRFPTQLNKVLKTTEDKTTEDKTTSSSYLPPQDQQEEEEVSEVSDALNSIEVFAGLWPEIYNAGWSNDEIISLVDQVKADTSAENKAGIFMYRLRNGQKPKSRGHSKDFLSGPFADYIKH